jgi:hypothetical protein
MTDYPPADANSQGPTDSTCHVQAEQMQLLAMMKLLSNPSGRGRLRRCRFGIDLFVRYRCGVTGDRSSTKLGRVVGLRVRQSGTVVSDIVLKLNDKAEFKSTW